MNTEQNTQPTAPAEDGSEAAKKPRNRRRGSSISRNRPRRPRLRTQGQKSVGAVILNEKNEVLIMYSSRNKYWEFPKGKVEPGEKELDTLKREMYEETGIENFRLHPEFKAFLRYNFRVGKLLIKKIVVYYLFKTGAEVKVSDEHTDFKWVPIEEVQEHLKHVNQHKLIKKVRTFLETHEL